MKFISSLELIESPVEKLALKGLPNEVAALRSNLRTSVISVNKNIMNDIRDAEGEVQLNGQIKHPPEMSSQVKNVLTLSSCDLTVKKVIIPAEWEKKLAESSSIDSNGLSESSRMSPGFATHKVNKVHLESKEKSDPPKEDSSVEIESLKSKSAHPTVLENTTSVPERSATETSNVTNGIDEWSNEASKSAGEESLSISNSPHTVATNVTNECSAKMPLQAESCSPKNAEYDVEVDESSTFLGIRVKDVKKCDSEKNELNDETERTEKLNSAFETDQSDTTFKDKINNIRHLDDKVSELDMPERSQENMIANKSNVTTDIQVNPAVESKKQSENSPKADDPNTEEDNEQFEEKTEIFNFYDKLTANAMHDKTNGIQAGNDFSSISSDDGNSKLADIVEDLENMGSLHAPNAEFDNSCNAVDQPNNFGSKYQLEEPDDAMSGLNDFVKARTDNVSEIDTQDNDKDLENVEGNDNIDAAMDVDDDDEIENGNVQLEIDKTDEHVDAKTDEHINAKIHELMDTEESMDAEEVVNEITELPDNEEGLDKTDEHEETKRDIDKSCELSNESAVGETSEHVSTDEMLGKIGNQEESKSVVDETCERKIEVPPDTSSESANAEESLSAIGKPEESEKIVDESHELLNEAPLGMVAESGKCEVNANETNELFNVAPGGETNKSSKAEEMLDKDRELSKQVGLIKSDGCADAETTLNKDSELHDEAALDKTNELDETKAISDRTSELGDKTTELTSALSSKTDEPDNDEEISDNSISIVDETMVDKTDKLDNVEAILDAPDKFVDEVASDKTDEPDDAEATSNETDDPDYAAEATSNETDDPDDAAQATLDKPDAFKDETVLNKTDEPDDAEATLDKPNDAEATLDKPDDAEATLDKPDDAEATLDKPDDAEATLDKPDDAEATLDKPDDAEATLDKPDDAEAMLDKHDEPDDTEATLDKPDEPDDAEAMLDKSDEPDDAEATLDKPEEPDDAEAMLDKSDESALNKTDEFDDAKATLDKSDENLDKVALGKLDESMDTKEALEESLEVESMYTEEASEERPKVESMDTDEALKESPKVEVDREVEKTAEGASKEGNVSESKVTPKENKESLECVLKDEAVSEESVDTKKKIVDVDSKTLPDSAGSEKCLESKPEKDAIVAVDKPAAKRLASEDVVTEVKRTKIDTEEGTLVTEDSSNSAAEGKEVNEEVFRTASKRLSEPVEVGEAKKPRLELGSEISDSGAADVGTVQDSDHSSQSEDKKKVEPESKSKEAVSVSDKVTDSTKKEEESSHVDSKASSEAAPTEKDASESKEEESSKPAEAATSNTEAESPKPAAPKQMSNLDLAIERVVAAAAAAAEAETTAIDIDDDDDEEVVATVPSKPSEPKKLYSLPFIDKLHSNIIKKMGRNELEEFVMQKVCEVLTERCQLGRLRQQVQALEEQNESWRKKTQMLQKQLKDLDLVMKRFVNDSRMKRDRPFPVKVTRSVGLQVHMPNNGPQQPGKQRSPGEPNRNQPTHRRRNRTSQNTSQPTQNAQQSQPATTTVATSSSPLSTTAVQQSQPQPQPQAAQSQVSTIQQQQPILAQMVTTPPAQPVKTMQQSARSPICSTVTVQKVVAPNLAKMGTTATIVHPRTSTSNLSNTAVKLPTSTKPVPIRPAITAVSTQNTITTVNSTAGSLSTGLRVASASQLNSRTIRPGVTATLCPVSKPVPGPDSKVIDLTDEDDKSKLNIVRFTTSTTATPVNSTVVTTATTSVHSGAIRVVHPHQLTGNTTATILTAGNQQPQSRFAYLMPSSGSPGQQRQVLIATSAAQVRPGMVTVSSRPTMSPTTFLLKNGSMLPIQQPTQAQTVTNATAILRPATSIQQPGTLQTVRAGQPVRVSPSLVGRIPTTNMPTLAPAINRQHPAPLPVQPMSQPSNPLWKCAPPKPELKTSRVNNNKQQGIVLSWNMQLTPEYEEIASYQLFAYQEGPAPPNTSLWKKVGDVKALPLPMACTLTQFMEGHKYHFAVRAVDVHSRVGPFSAPRNIVLTRK